MNKKQGSLLSVVSNTTLVALKFFVGLITNSISVISEAIHSSIDLLASFVAFISIRKSTKPPDADHPYGHGKFESIAGFFEAVLIFFAAGIIIYEAVERIIKPSPLEKPELGIAVMFFSGFVNLTISLTLFRIAKKEDSIALKANALHLSTDTLTSLGVALGLLAIHFTNLHILDPIIAIIVAILIIRASTNLTKEAIEELSDRSLSNKELEDIENIILSNRGVISFHKLRTRKTGKVREIDLHLVVDGNLSLKEAHKLSHTVSDKIKDKYPGSTVMIHIEPGEKEEKHLD